MRNQKGITLVMLVVTIVVLLILIGISLTVLDSLVIDKAIVASSVTTEEFLREQIEMAWIDSEMSYIEDKKTTPNIVKNDYFVQQLSNRLTAFEKVSGIDITGTVDTALYISFVYDKQNYTFSIAPNGNVDIIYLLKGTVKVGDYVQYPIEYSDIYSDEHFTKQTGWRVIDDGIMEGTSGQVKIISTGAPAKWYYDPTAFANNSDAVENLINNFENLNLVNTKDDNMITGSYFKIDTIADKVTTLSLADLNLAYNKIHGTNRLPSDTTKLSENDNLFYLKNPQVYYWLATNKLNDEVNIHYVSSGEIKDISDIRIGIRPVICLKEDLTGVQNLGSWKIID